LLFWCVERLDSPLCVLTGSFEGPSLSLSPVALAFLRDLPRSLVVPTFEAATVTHKERSALRLARYDEEEKLARVLDLCRPFIGSSHDSLLGMRKSRKVVERVL
jgi:hypothetical protein